MSGLYLRKEKTTLELEGRMSPLELLKTWEESLRSYRLGLLQSKPHINRRGLRLSTQLVSIVWIFKKTALSTSLRPNLV